MHSIGNAGLWTAFVVIIIAALVVDFLVLRSNGARRVAFRDALVWSAAWIALALAFDLALWWWLGVHRNSALADEIALEFLTGYVVEKSLAIDNIFVFLMVFNYFAVPAGERKRVLMLGVLGAIVLRAIMIFVGAELVQRFHWILYLFGLFLIFTGVKMLRSADETPDLESNPALRFIRRRLPLSPKFRDGALSFVESGRRVYTPLFVVIVLIAVTDVVFAVDSIPAIFAVTVDPFVVLTSNVFAVLGLRAIFFMLEGAAARFHLLSYGLAAVLLFIGAKMLIAGVWKIPIALALGVVAILIAASMIASLYVKPKALNAENHAA